VLTSRFNAASLSTLVGKYLSRGINNMASKILEDLYGAKKAKSSSYSKEKVAEILLLP
jgi:hypothetical protein